MVVGAGHRHHLGYAELAQPAFRDGGELRWISDRTGGDDRALTLHQPGHRRHGPDATRIGEHDGGATQVIGGQLSRAGFRDQRFVLIAERRKIQPVRIANHRHQQHPAAVLPLHVDRQPQVDAAGHPSGRAVDPLECHRHRRNVLHRVHDRKSDQVRVRNLLRPPRGLDRLIELPPSLVEQVDPHRAKAGRGGHLTALLHVLDQGRGGAPQRDRSGWRLGRGRWSGRLLCSSLLRSSLLSLDGLGDVASTDRSAWPAALDGRQIDALCSGEQFGALGYLHFGGCLATIWRGRCGRRRFPFTARRGRCRRRRFPPARGGGQGRSLVTVGANLDLRQRGADRYRLACLREDLQQFAAGGRRDFSVNLVGGDLNQRFAFSHRVARLLQPLGDGPLGDRLTHLGQGDLHGRLGHDEILPTKLGCEYELQGEVTRQ